jgi:hypothetical protein
MASRTFEPENAETVFLRALEKYSNHTITSEIIQCKSNLASFLRGEYTFDSTQGITCVVSDPGEEFDDIMMLYGVYSTIGNVIVVISGGLHTPQERLNYLIRVNPQFQGATFADPFPTPSGTIQFIPDGEVIPQKVKRFVNCGPCSKTTLDSLMFEENAVIITVGANEDGTLSTGINQKQTLGNKLIVEEGVWNRMIERGRKANAKIKNMSVDVTRHVLFPNPLKTQCPEFMRTPELLNAMFKTAAMFIISRPPIEYGYRANDGNSEVGIQLYSTFDKTTTDYQMGLIKLQEYIDIGIQKKLEPKYYESAAIPLMITHCMKGRYKESMFGFSPADKEAKENMSCLTPESSIKVLEHIKTLDELTPAYDPLAYLEAFI